MRKSVIFATTFAIVAVAVLGLARYAGAQSPSLFLPAVQVPERSDTAAITEPAVTEVPQRTEIPPRPSLEELGPPVTVERIDLVPELPLEEKTFVAFRDDEGNLFGYFVHHDDIDKIWELAEKYGPIVALHTPMHRIDRGDPGEPDFTPAPTPSGTPEYVSDPNFVHPDPVMPPHPPPWAREVATGTP